MTQPGESSSSGDEQLRYLQQILDTLGGAESDDLDRILPASVSEALTEAGEAFSEEELAQIRGGDREGVPVPYTFQFVNAIEGWLDRVDSEGPSAELTAEITAGIGIREARYPDSPIWDRMRGHVAVELQRADDLDSAMQLVFAMRSKHAMARAVTDLTEGLPPGDDQARIVAMVMARLVADPDPSGLREFLQASYDETVKVAPDSFALNDIELMLRRFNPVYDPIQSWAESMAKDVPEVNWERAAAIARDDEQWSDAIPVRFRQYALATHYEHLRALTEQANDQNVEAIINDLTGVESETPRARIWDQFRYSYAARLLESGHPNYAADFGLAIHNAEQQQALVVEMLEHGAEDEAMRVTNEMTDATVMVQTLLDGDWSGDKGVTRLATIVDDDSYPLGRRIECVVAVRERMREFGNMESVERHDALITTLRQRLAEQ